MQPKMLFPNEKGLNPDGSLQYNIETQNRLSKTQSIPRL